MNRGAAEAVYSDTLSLDLSKVVPSLAGPKRPQDRVAMNELKAAFEQALSRYLETMGKMAGVGASAKADAAAAASTAAETATKRPSAVAGTNSRVPVPGTDYDLGHGMWSLRPSLLAPIPPIRL